jgi:hypothetical protein
LGQRTIISTLSIIFGRCPQTKKEHKSSDRMQLSCSVSHNDAGTAQKGARCLNQLAAMDRP